MSEITLSPVGIMQRVLIDEFKSIPPELLSPEQRVDHLFEALNARKDDLVTHGRSILGLALNALDDMQFIGAGAVRYATDVCPDESLDDHVTLVKRSIPKLVFPAHLSDGQWQEVRLQYSEKSSPAYERTHLSPDVLFIMSPDDAQERVISYSSAALIDMDSRISVTGDRGCPARGIVIQSSLCMFVEAVFNPAQSPDLHQTGTNPTNQLLNVQ